ncbi:hypothetical protein ACJX0J_032849, partial [Zea mays]
MAVCNDWVFGQPGMIWAKRKRGMGWKNSFFYSTYSNYSNRIDIKYSFIFYCTTLGTLPVSQVIILSIIVWHLIKRDSLPIWISLAVFQIFGHSDKLIEEMEMSGIVNPDRAFGFVSDHMEFEQAQKIFLQMIQKEAYEVWEYIGQGTSLYKGLADQMMDIVVNA